MAMSSAPSERLDYLVRSCRSVVLNGFEAPVLELESRLGQRHEPAMAGRGPANALNLLPLAAALSDLLLAEARRE